MFNTHLPEPIYERLPVIYMVIAFLLLLSPLDDLKWIAIVALTAASLVTRLLRRVHRDAATP